MLLNTATAKAKGLVNGDIVRIESPYGSIVARISGSEGVHPETVCVSNALSRIATQNTAVRLGGGNYNELLPTNLRHTDACSGQPETVAKVKLTKLTVMPTEFTTGNSTYTQGRGH